MAWPTRAELIRGGQWHVTKVQAGSLTLHLARADAMSTRAITGAWQEKLKGLEGEGETAGKVDASMEVLAEIAYRLMVDEKGDLCFQSREDAARRLLSVISTEDAANLLKVYTESARAPEETAEGKAPA